MANRHTQDAPAIPAGCELGAYDHQLPLACPAGVPGCEGRGHFGFIRGGRQWQQR